MHRICEAPAPRCQVFINYKSKMLERRNNNLANDLAASHISPSQPALVTRICLSSRDSEDYFCILKADARFHSSGVREVSHRCYHFIEESARVGLEAEGSDD